MPIKIVTDSISDLPDSLAQAYGITVIPCYVNVDGQSFLDGIELTRPDFYQRLPQYKNPPTTSAPGIGAFKQAYDRAIQEGANGIISIHVAASFSNLLNVASLAAEAIPTIPITVVDSGQLSLGEGLLAVEAARAAQKGKNQEEIIAHIQNTVPRTYLYGILDTLDYLHRSGRLSWMEASLGTWLDIKPVFMVNRGHVSLNRTRTYRKATEHLFRQVVALGPLEQVALIHSHPPLERMALFDRQVHQHLRVNGSLITTDINPAVVSHVGPAALGVVAIQAPV